MSDELQVRSTGDGTVLPVRLVPRSGRSEIDGVHDGALRVRVKAPPVDGAANKALCEFLAKTLGISKRRVAISSGERSRSKSVAIEGLDPAEVKQRLQREST